MITLVSSEGRRFWRLALGVVRDPVSTRSKTATPSAFLDAVCLAVAHVGSSVVDWQSARPGCRQPRWHLGSLEALSHPGSKRVASVCAVGQPLTSTTVLDSRPPG